MKFQENRAIGLLPTATIPVRPSGASETYEAHFLVPASVIMHDVYDFVR